MRVNSEGLQTDPILEILDDIIYLKDMLLEGLWDLAKYFDDKGDTASSLKVLAIIFNQDKIKV